MERKKFTVNGREKETFELSNEELLMLIEKGDITEDERNLLKDKAVERFKYGMCARNGEDSHNVFVRQFSEFVNGRCHDMTKVGELMTREHRYLQQEMFKVCLAYIKQLAKCNEDGRFDPRNEWACQTAANLQYYYEGL